MYWKLIIALKCVLLLMRTGSASFQEKHLQRVCEALERVWEAFAKGLRSVCKGFEKRLKRFANRLTVVSKGFEKCLKYFPSICKEFPKGLPSVWKEFAKHLKHCQTLFVRSFKRPKNAVFDKTCFPMEGCIWPFIYWTLINEVLKPDLVSVVTVHMVYFCALARTEIFQRMPGN